MWLGVIEHDRGRSRMHNEHSVSVSRCTRNAGLVHWSLFATSILPSAPDVPGGVLVWHCIAVWAVVDWCCGTMRAHRSKQTKWGHK